MNNKIIFPFLISLLITNIAASQILFTEHFDDTNFVARGWYDNTSNVTLSNSEHSPGSTSSIQYTWNIGQTVPLTGGGMRMLFTPTDELFVSYWVKYSSNYIGSGVAYHPHEINILTDADNMWIGPAGTHLTAYIEHNAGHPRLALQDLLNVDTNCILQNNNNFVGCNGNFNTYPFTENRSVCSCNGLAGPVDGRDCFQSGSNPTQWYSARFWRANTYNLLDSSWHHLLVHFKMNSIAGGIGQTDGIMQYWLDGQLILNYDSILYRTGANANMKFNQFMIAPYIGVGSPLTQTFWMDELTVSRQPINLSAIEYSKSSLKISLSPVPVKSDLVIKLENLNISMIKLIIINPFGEIINEEEINIERYHHIDISNLANGLYFLIVESKNQNGAGKFIIQH